MWKFLLGPLVMGAAYIGGSIYGSDAEQIVHQPPSVVYAGIEQALANVRPGGTAQFEGARPVPYELKIERSADERLLVRLIFDGRQGAEADIHFVPQNGGGDTLMTVKIHTDHAVLRQALAGSDKAKLGYAPDWMLNLTLRPVLTQLAGQIENGQPVGAGTGFISRADWEAQLPPDQQEQLQKWRQYDAARPMVDPDEAARNYVGGGSN